MYCRGALLPSGKYSMAATSRMIIDSRRMLATGCAPASASDKGMDVVLPHTALGTPSMTMVGEPHW